MIILNIFINFVINIYNKIYKYSQIMNKIIFSYENNRKLTLKFQFSM